MQLRHEDIHTHDSATLGEILEHSDPLSGKKTVEGRVLLDADVLLDVRVYAEPAGQVYQSYLYGFKAYQEGQFKLEVDVPSQNNIKAAVISQSGPATGITNIKVYQG